MNDLRQSENWGKHLAHMGWETFRVGKSRESGTLVFLKKMGPVSIIKIQRAEDLTQEKLNDIDQIAKDQKALFVKIETVSEKDGGLLEENGYERNFFPLLTPTTIRIDLTKNEDVLWKALDKDARYLVKRAKREGFETKFYENPGEELQKTAHALFSETGKRKKFYVQPLSDLQSKIKSFGQDAIFAVTQKGDEIATISLILCHSKTAFYVHVGSKELGKREGANYLFVWSIMLYLKARGIKYFDLEGITDDRFPDFTKRWYGFTFFKKKFGGEIVQFPPPYIKLYNNGMKFFRKVSRKPLPL